jgi:holliday junction resolvase Hjr
MTHYDEGRRFEWKTRDHLTANGYEVFRSAGSHTKVDLIGMKSGQLIFVQCKRNGVCTPTERTELLRLARLIDGSVPVVASLPHVTFRRLTGPGPKEWQPWTPDELGGTT